MYARAPLARGACSTTGQPKLGASDTLTSRGITVSKTISPKKLSHLLIDLRCQLQRMVVHREQDSSELQLLFWFLHDSFDHLDHLSQTFHGKVLTLNRHQDFARH